MDQQLGLTLWPPAGRSRPVGLLPVGPAGALQAPPDEEDEGGRVPSWWHGDEAESQAFLKAEGIELD